MIRLLLITKLKILILVTFFTSLDFQIAAQDFEFADLEELPVEEMRVQIYTKKFADRFSLPLDSIDDELIGGIEAIEFFVVKNWHPSANYYGAFLRIYIDDGLPVAFPNTQMLGNRFLHDPSAHFFTRDNIPNWKNESDIDFYTSQLRGYYMNFHIASDGYIAETQGFRNSIPIHEFERNIVEGINYFELHHSNLSLNYVEDGTVEKINLWLRKADIGPHSGGDILPQDYIQIPIPTDFILKIIPHANLVMERYRELTLRRRILK